MSHSSSCRRNLQRRIFGSASSRFECIIEGFVSSPRQCTHPLRFSASFAGRTLSGQQPCSLSAQSDSIASSPDPSTSLSPDPPDPSTSSMTAREQGQIPYKMSQSLYEFVMRAIRSETCQYRKSSPDSSVVVSSSSTGSSVVAGQPTT